jgi:hypothetical protein
VGFVPYGPAFYTSYSIYCNVGRCLSGEKKTSLFGMSGESAMDTSFFSYDGLALRILLLIQLVNRR